MISLGISLTLLGLFSGSRSFFSSLCLLDEVIEGIPLAVSPLNLTVNCNTILLLLIVRNGPPLLVLNISKALTFLFNVQTKSLNLFEVIIIGLLDSLTRDRFGRLDVHILDSQYLTWLFLGTDLVRINTCLCNKDLFDSGIAILMLWLGSFGFFSGFDQLICSTPFSLFFFCFLFYFRNFLCSLLICYSWETFLLVELG